jgi:hypothetical protein
LTNVTSVVHWPMATRAAAIRLGYAERMLLFSASVQRTHVDIERLQSSEGRMGS